MAQMTSRQLPENVQLERELGQLIDQVWGEASGRPWPAERVRMRGAAYGLAARLFIAGKIAARPSVEFLEQVITRVRETSQGSADENRIIAEAVLHLIKNYDLRVYKGPGPSAGQN
jgi:hypothetical protein